MSILTASNPLILALVLSLYHVSKESYRILKLKKILICSTIGVFTLIFFLHSYFWTRYNQIITMPSSYSHCSALPAILQILPHQMPRPLLTKLDSWTVPYLTRPFSLSFKRRSKRHLTRRLGVPMRWDTIPSNSIDYAWYSVHV